MSTARELSDRLSQLLRAEHGALADFVVVLADFDRRRLWADLGHASLFDFLVRELGLSRGSAHYRKVAARLVQEHPEVEAALRDCSLCFSSVVELSKVVTRDNAAEILPRFLHRSKQEAKAVVAELQPEPEPALRSIVTGLPLTPTRTVSAVEPVERSLSPRPVQPVELVTAPAVPPAEPVRAAPARPAVDPMTEDLSRQYPLPGGERCGSTYQCELDHVTPNALGGRPTVDELRVCCKPHNQLAARLAFGDAFIERRIRERRAHAAAARAGRLPSATAGDVRSG